MCVNMCVCDLARISPHSKQKKIKKNLFLLQKIAASRDLSVVTPVIRGNCRDEISADGNFKPAALPISLIPSDCYFQVCCVVLLSVRKDWGLRSGKLFSQRCSSRRQYRRGLDCVAGCWVVGGGWAGGGNTLSFVPRWKLFLGLPSTFRRGSTVELPQVAFTRLCMCVCVCRRLQRYAQNPRDPLSRWQRGMCQGVCACFTSTKDSFKTMPSASCIEQCKPVKVITSLHISLIHLNTHLGYLQQSAPMWNLTLYMHGMYVVCVLHDSNSPALLWGYLIEGCFPTTGSAVQPL